ncbi:CocE/NonD family hydrolase [Biformimicrobium ophioploci]|uniref:CocE/NonD family hydrolase n=1 Tax=Biformimicrobium ophioploci TaxID=3036711 RepID=A0ABQ6LVP2_9GAMM|nr:CocE/NonD family hydrolase [Microbulbifer sp. NKW57]GMG86156.1 CocE/NonD family hydrolase [Microbulbifer sp. NKW57]
MLLWALSCAAHAELALKSQMVPMRDGIHLSTDVYFHGALNEPRPTILIRTVYNKRGTFGWNPVWKILVEQGYAVVIQDIRGRYESEGVYTVARGRREDGVDTLDWIVAQPWSNGRVGLSGCSYLGEAQVVLQATHHPALVVGQPQSPASGYYRPGRAWQSFSGGAFELGQTAGWFANDGTKYFYGPPLSGAARSEWFQSDHADGYQAKPKQDFQRYLGNIASLPVMTLLSRSGISPTDFEDWRESEPDGDYFRSMDLVQAGDSTAVPNLFFDTWYDYGARETLMMANQFRRNATTSGARNHQFVVIGPGTHCNYPEQESELSAGDRPLANTSRDYVQMQLDWYDYWLRGNTDRPVKRPFLTYYVLGADQWRTADAWPIPGTQRTRWYLSSPQPANSLRGGGRLQTVKPPEQGSDQFTYDPAHPVPSLGGHTCCTGSSTEAGGYDQSAIEMRDDVLVYSSPPLEEGMEVTGLIHARLFVSSSARDTDFTVKLVDVYPDGRAFNVQEGVQRMRYRNSLRSQEFMVPGTVYAIDVDLNATSNYFAKGHRIRVEISSSNFPRIERNLNTGRSNATTSEFVTAENTVWFGAERASYVELPVVPREGAGKERSAP